MSTTSSISKFTQLKAWQESHKLAVAVYEVTKDFPSSEQYTLTSQMRRCAVSVSSNIAEGFGRSSQRDKARFYDFAKGSLLELQNQTILARDVQLISRAKFTSLAEQSIHALKLIHGLQRANNKKG